MRLPYYSMYPKDFDTDAKVRGMEDSELGLYIRCLNHSWVNDGLPADPEEIRRAFRDTPKAFSQKWSRVETCFPLADDGRRRNPRQEKERAQALDKSSKASANAKRAHSERSARASGSESESESSAVQGESAERGRGETGGSEKPGQFHDGACRGVFRTGPFREPDGPLYRPWPGRRHRRSHPVREISGKP